MHLQAGQYFALIVPACSILFGAVLVACWRFMPHERSLPWLAAGYVLNALPLAAQSLMTNEQLASWTLYTGVLYLGCAWAMAHGMALRYGGSAHPRWALAIGAATLGLLLAYSRLTDDLWMRVLCLNLGLAALLALGLGDTRQAARAQHLPGRLLRGIYLLLVAYALARPVVWWLVSPAATAELTRSGYWLLMLAANIVVGLLFMAVLLADTVGQLVRVLKTERDLEPLTGLLNRRAFFEQAERLLAIPGTPGRALLVCDLDHFKQVNDTGGHAAGDRVLQAVSQVLREQVRAGDLVARFGGEEFVVLAACADLPAAAALAERIRARLARMPCRATGRAVTGSLGVAWAASAQALPEALKRADALLYQAKQAGRNRVAWELGSAAQRTPHARALTPAQGGGQ